MLFILIPLFFIVSLLILIDSKGGVFYKQTRIGINEKEFLLFKFRSMHKNSDKARHITTVKDERITRVGRFIRKYKIDELPQLINIIKGDMSIVGPRPEMPSYVELYDKKQRKVLSVRPGLTDYASLMYINEQSILEKSENPEKTYVEQIMPHKLELGLRYIEEKSFITDYKIIIRTIIKLFK